MPRVGSVFVLAVVVTGLALAGEGEHRLGFEAPENGVVPLGWRHVTFPSIERSTRYSSADEDSECVVHAFADRSASVLLRPVPQDISLEETPLLSWRWRVEESVPRGDGKEKSTDDFPARIWVGFETDWSKEGYFARREAEKARERYGFDPPGYWIHYVWAGSGREKGETFDEPYSPDRFKCVALRNEQDSLNQWFREARDPRADFEKLYGRPAPRIVAVAIMTDTDDTNSQARASYADLAFVSS